jgi:hypothetical protein
MSTVSSASSASSSGSGTEDDSTDGKQTTLLTRKRACPTPANNASRKPKDRRLTRIQTRARQQKLSPPRKKAALSPPSDAGHSSEAQSSGDEVLYSKYNSDESGEESDDQDRHLRVQSKRIASRPVSCSQSNTKNSLFTHAPLQADRKTRHVTKSIAARKAEWYAADVTIHSLSADLSFLTALFRTRSGPGVLSPSCAASVLKNRLGQVVRLADITIKLLTPDTWFLTSLVECASDAAALETGQPVSALSSLQLNRADVALAQRYSRPSNSIDDEFSSDGYDIDNDEHHEHQSGNVDEPSSSRKQSRWLPEDDKRLREWKKAGHPWDWICRKFPERSPGSVKTHWYTKFHGKA